MKDARKFDLPFQARAIPAKTLVAVQGRRIEPITYWIRLGDGVVRGGLEQKLKTIQLGMDGKVADGLLFRVSSIDPDVSKALDIQKRFIQELLQATDPAALPLLLGQPAVAQ